MSSSPSQHSLSSATAPEVLAWRTRMLLTVICGAWIVLALRLVELQWFHRQRFAEQVEGQSVHLEEVAARPGDIFDREGRVLATSIAAKSLFVVPSQISKQPKQWEIIQAIADAAEQDADQLQARIAQHSQKHFLWVRRRITDRNVLAKLHTIKLPKSESPLLGFRDEFLRQYPQGYLAAHVLGGRDVDGIGRGGIEQSLNSRLAGKPGYRQLTLDSRQRVIEVETEIDRAPEHGQSVTLTLDTVIQLHVEQELDRVMERWRAKHAAAIVLDPKTGEVLAMASRPTYDPNDLAHVDIEAWKNQAIAAMYEPGSTFKPMVVGWGIEHGFIRRDESFHCENGEYRMGRRILHDHHPYGVLSLTDVLVKSSNIGMAKIGQRMGNEALFQSAVAFGFGRRTGIELPGELSGMLHPLNRWTSYSTGSIPMGQEIAVTPIQLIAAHAALANGGLQMSPRLVRSHHMPPAGRPWAEKSEYHERTAGSGSLLQQIAFQTAAGSRRIRQFGIVSPREEEPPLAAEETLDAVEPPRRRSLSSQSPLETESFDDRFDTSDDGIPFNDEELLLDDLVEESPVMPDSPLASPVVSETISPEVSRWLVETVMSDVVKRGTGRKARLDDYTVFGKTGTAQKRDPRTGKYSNRLHVSSFVGGAPAANPRVVVLVMVDEPMGSGEHFGGDIAAPPAREIIHKSLRQLGVPPEHKPR